MSFESAKTQILYINFDLEIKFLDDFSQKSL